MKAVIGIDAAGAYEPALRLFARLKFPNPEPHLINVADLVMPYTSFGVPPALEATNQFVEGLRQAGECAVKEARCIAKTYGLTCESAVIAGPSVLTILDEADNLGADLISVASTRKGAFATIFTGSMSRSIVSSSRHSILVAKEGVKTDGPVECVLATDHSTYADRAIDQFLALKPVGISKIHVVTAFDISNKETEILYADLPDLEGHIDQWIEGKLAEKSKALVGKLSQHGYISDYTLKQGNPNSVIADEMTRTNSEMLILGAQGHGFLDRLFVGSVSFHQLVAEPYSVLIMRPR